MSSDRTKFGGGRGGLVHVDAYDQQRHGHTVDVRQHYRSWPGGGGWHDGAELGAPFLRFKSIDLGLRTKIEPKPEVLRALGLTLDDFVVREKKPPRLQNFEAGVTPVSARADGPVTSPTAAAKAENQQPAGQHDSDSKDRRSSDETTGAVSRAQKLKISVEQRRLIIRTITAETSSNLADPRLSLEAKERLIEALFHSIVNRVGAPTFPKSLDEVMAKPKAFANTDTTNKLFPKTENIENLAPGDRRSYALVEKVVDRVVANPGYDPTNGATYFYNGDPNDRPDSWFANSVESGALKRVQIGDTGTWRFYTDELNKPSVQIRKR